MLSRMSKWLLFSLLVLVLRCDPSLTTPILTEQFTNASIEKIDTDSNDSMVDLQFTETIENDTVIHDSTPSVIEFLGEAEKEEEELESDEISSEPVEETEEVQEELIKDEESGNIAEHVTNIASVVQISEEPNEIKSAAESTEASEPEENQKATVTTPNLEEESPAPCMDPSHNHRSLDVETQTREHLEWSAKSVTQLMSRLVQILEVPTADWNEYRYITALRGPDGSLYVPQNHGQSTRKHLATLLGFADEIIVSKNALAQSDDKEPVTGNMKHQPNHDDKPAHPDVPEFTTEAMRTHVNATTTSEGTSEVTPHNSDISDGADQHDQLMQSTESDGENNVNTVGETNATELHIVDHTPATEEVHASITEKPKNDGDLHRIEQSDLKQMIDNVGDLVNMVSPNSMKEFLEHPDIVLNKLENLTKPFVDDLEAVAEKHVENILPVIKEMLSTEVNNHSEKPQDDEENVEEMEQEHDRQTEEDEPNV